MKRLSLVLTAWAAPLCAAFGVPNALGQAAMLPRRVGLLTVSSEASFAHSLQALRDGLRERGHVEDRDIVIDARYFDLLIEILRPKVLFVHEGSAVRICEERFGVQLSRGEFVPVVHEGARFDVLAGHHLAYQWSFAAVEELGATLLGRAEALASGYR